MHGISHTGRRATSLLALVLWACGSGEPAEELAPPNIVLIISDDQDPTHLGFLGHPVAQTPAIDSLADAGVVFPFAYTQPRCRPTLAGLLSGRYAHQHRIYFNEGAGELESVQVLPALLRDAGYATFAQGKFWEGDARKMGFTHGPGKDLDLVRRDQDAVLRFLEEAGEDPFFVWYAPRLPHVPHNPPAEYLDKYRQAELAIPTWIPADRQREFRRLEATSHAMETWLDDGVKVLLDQLKAQGHWERTLVIFLIDNGWANGYPSKGTAFERGIRTPLVFCGPGIRVGETVDALASYLDVMPTILDFAGVPIPETCVGTSLRPLLEGREGPRRDILFGAVYSGLASDDSTGPEQDLTTLHARTGPWKYLLSVQDVVPERNVRYHRILHALTDFPARTKGTQELYDLGSDPDERTNLADRPEHQELIQRLRRETLEWWRSTGGGPLDLEGS